MLLLLPLLDVDFLEGRLLMLLLLLAPRKVVIRQQLFLFFYVLLVGSRGNDVVGDFLYTFSEVKARFVSFIVLF